MPHMSMRISASSSTTRISCAMSRGLFYGFFCRARRRNARIGAVEDERHACAAAFAILEDQFPAMVFHDLLDDGKAESRALGAGRNVRLGQAVAPLRRQSSAIILDDQRGLLRRLADAKRDHAGRH